MKLRIFMLTLLLLLTLSASALAQTGGTYDLSWNVTSDGGGTMFSSGGAFTLGGTFGQVGVNALSGGTYALQGGFWIGTRPNITFIPKIYK
jgi:hypothetical protein